MGYTTKFEGFFTIAPPLEGEPKALFNGLCNTRRVVRETDPKFGIEGEYYVDYPYDEGRILDENRPPRTQPSLYCEWKLSEDGTKLCWNGMEKFYGYTEWLRYIITRVIPEGTVLSGEVRFAGEDEDDKGEIQIIDNRIRVVYQGGEQLRPANLDTEDICNKFRSMVPDILQSLAHYRDHHACVLGLPLKVHHYISYIQGVADEVRLHRKMPEREWVTGQYGDVTQAVYFSALLNPKLMDDDDDVKRVLSAYNNLFDIDNNVLERLPKALFMQKYWATDEHYIKTEYRSLWNTRYTNPWVNLSYGRLWFKSYMLTSIRNMGL